MHASSYFAGVLALVGEAAGFAPVAVSLPVHPTDWTDATTPRTDTPARFWFAPPRPDDAPAERLSGVE